MSTLQEHLATIRRFWDRHDVMFDALCVNLVRGHMKELEALAANPLPDPPAPSPKEINRDD